MLAKIIRDMVALKKYLVGLVGMIGGFTKKLNHEKLEVDIPPVCLENNQTKHFTKYLAATVTPFPRLVPILSQLVIGFHVFLHLIHHLTPPKSLEIHCSGDTPK